MTIGLYREILKMQNRTAMENDNYRSLPLIAIRRAADVRFSRSPAKTGPSLNGHLPQPTVPSHKLIFHYRFASLTVRLCFLTYWIAMRTKLALSLPSRANASSRKFLASVSNDPAAGGLSPRVRDTPSEQSKISSPGRMGSVR